MRAAHSGPRSLGLATVLLAAAPAAAQYRIVEIAPGAQPTSINVSREVVGTIEVGDHTHCFFWDGSLHDLGTLGAGHCHAAGLSDRGQMVGTRMGLVDESWQAFRCDVRSGRCQDLPAPAPGWVTVGLGVNAAGLVVGGTWDDAGRARPFVFDGRDSRLLAADLEGIARAINDAGVVVGAAATSTPGETRPFRWEGGALSRLGTLGGRAGEAWAVGATGIVAGTSSRADGRPIAFRQAGRREDLDALVDAPASYGRSVNAAGWVVGAFDTPSGRHAFLADRESVYDLNDLVPPAAAWILEAATAINDRGEIVGQGRHAGRPAGFVLALPSKPCAAPLAPALCPGEPTGRLGVEEDGTREVGNHPQR